MKYLLPFLFFSSISFSSSGQTVPKSILCLSTREFVTTLEFLREHKEFSLSEQDARLLSEKVSDGCTGASKRFIQVLNVLVKAGVPTKKAIEIGLKFGQSSDDKTAAFLTIFKGSYIESLLDLDVNQAMKIALELSDTYEGKSKLVEKNFNLLVEFCVDKKSLDLPLPECARLAARVVKNGSDHEFYISNEFISLFNYLTDEKAANLPTFEALVVSEFVTKFGPEAKKNFIPAYEYAVNKKGLDRSVKDAIEFGKTMASKSVKKELKDSDK
jgi:hypothetical protein